MGAEACFALATAISVRALPPNCGLHYRNPLRPLYKEFTLGILHVKSHPLNQLLRHRLFAAQYPAQVGSADAESGSELIATACLYHQLPRDLQPLFPFRPHRPMFQAKSFSGGRQSMKEVAADELTGAKTF